MLVFFFQMLYYGAVCNKIDEDYKSRLMNIKNDILNLGILSNNGLVYQRD